MSTSARLRRLAAPAAILAALFVSGCGGDSDAGTPGGATTTAAGNATIGQNVTIGKSFWHAGWKVDLTTATTKAPERGSKGAVAAIEAVFNNLGTETSRFESRLILRAGGNDIEASVLETQLPDVPGGAKQSGDLVFPVKDGFTLADAVLVVGNPANNQATVPFGATGSLVTQEPRPVPVTISGSVTYPIHNVKGTIAIKVTGGELRADIPQGHNEAKKGQLALTLTYSVTYTYGDIYSYYWNDNNLLLELPDGSSVGPDAIDAEPTIKPGATVDGLTVRFLIKDPAAGDYKLILKNNGAATPAIPIPFTLTLA